ncbi:MAG TPA: SDR family NAD(P)-dependent oxidoreductase, partial [Phenylobacterium sp.]|nr:SDR family NAD(P)-dependent oxidoreductase [Phenylobacterium sp.]
AQALAGGIAILVNTAGCARTGAVEEASPAEVRAQFEANVFGPLAVLRAALPGMRARRSGHVINVTSVSGLAAWAGTGIYCASKFALEGIGETLAQEVGRLGIKVTNVAPGGLRTAYAGASLTRAAQVIEDYAETAHLAPRLLAEHAGQESGDPVRAAQAILKIAGAEDAPLRLLLGEDALHYALRKMGQMTSEIGDWAGLSTSIAFPKA